ncbi:hypothetical protein OUZ56_021711 [Daphnia magna]|uniref:Uncharacterized protein n=1 Tax=Daphnia magna TaxID=35525 RepID=A0ABR0AU90_9CRUS|nr:hypothetical protein OUZ56_021711 [Daphnia magna]
MIHHDTINEGDSARSVNDSDVRPSTEAETPATQSKDASALQRLVPITRNANEVSTLDIATSMLSDVTQFYYTRETINHITTLFHFPLSSLQRQQPVHHEPLPPQQPADQVWVQQQQSAVQDWSEPQQQVVYSTSRASDSDGENSWIQK